MYPFLLICGVSINMYGTSEERAKMRYMPICRITHPQSHYGANDETPTTQSISTSVNIFPGYLLAGREHLRRPRHGTRQYPAASCYPECRIRISNTAARRGHTAYLAHRTPARQGWWPRYRSQQYSMVPPALAHPDPWTLRRDPRRLCSNRAR